MTFATIRVSTDSPVARVTLNRPDALNAITPQMLDELGAAFSALRDDSAVHVVILTGEGRAFSAGVDLKALQGRPIVDGAVGDVLDVPARRLIELMRTMDAVVIAAVNGFCFTGALEIALATDLVVAAEDAVFADTHAKFGLRPTWGMSQRLPRAVGPARARWLSYTARQFSGREAEQWGLAALACPREELLAQADQLAQTIARNSAGSLAAYKGLYREVDARALDAGLAYEASTRYRIPDTEERVKQFR